MDISKTDTAVLVTDPQNDFLSEKGVTWQLVGDSVKENNTIENIDRILRAAKNNGLEVFISPHYYSSGPHHQDSGEAKIRESTAGVSRKPSSDGKARGSSSKHLCGLTAWNT